MRALQRASAKDYASLGLTMALESFPITSRAAWLTMRKRDFTASDAGTLFNCHPQKTLLEVYAEKAGLDVDRGDTIAMRRGRLMQPAVRQALLDDHNLELVEPAVYVRDSDARLGATPDYLIAGTLEPVEVKTVSPEVWADDWGSGARVPLHIQLQAVTQCHLLRAKRALVPVMVMNRRLQLERFWIDHHKAAARKVVDAVRVFWEDFDAGKVPAPDFSIDAPTINEMFRHRAGTGELDWSSNSRMSNVVADFLKAQAAAKKTRDRVTALAAEIKMALGESTIARIGSTTVSWAPQTRAQTVAKASTYRSLKVTTPNEEIDSDF